MKKLIFRLLGLLITISGITPKSLLASHVAGELITLKKLPNGNSVFKIWVLRDCSGSSFSSSNWLSIRALNNNSFAPINCFFTSVTSVSNECIPNSSSSASLNCPAPVFTSGLPGAYQLLLFESAPFSLSQFTFSPNQWIDFFSDGIPCCAPNYNNSNASMNELNAILRLKTDVNGKVIAKSTINVKEWPQTSYTLNSNATYNWMVRLIGEADDRSTWNYTFPRDVISNNMITTYSYNTATPLTSYQRPPNTDVVSFLPASSTSPQNYLMYLEAQQKVNGEHIATLWFYTSIRTIPPAPGFALNQSQPVFSTLPTPFAMNNTPVFYYMPGDTVEFPGSVSNQFVYNNMTLNNRLVGEFATPCNSAPCATISPLPGTTAANLLFQGKPTGSVMTFTGNDSSRLNFKFQWLPNFQHLDYDSTLQSYSSKLIPFYFHGYNTMCPTSVHSYQPFFISLFNPNPPLVRPANAQILPGDSCRVQVAASLDSTPANANAMGVDYQVYLQKQSQLRMLCHLESSDSPFGPFQRCSPQQPMVYNSGNSAFSLTLTDSTISGASAQTKWYKVVNLAYSRTTLLKTTVSKAFQAFTNPAQLPNVQVKPDTVCHGVPTRLKAVSTNGAQDPVYEWRFNGVVQSSTTDELTLARLTSTDSVRVVIISRSGGANLNSVSSAVARPARVQAFFPQISRQGDSLVSSIPFRNKWYNLGSGSLANDTLFWIKPSAGNFGPYTVVNQQKYCAVNSPDTVSFFPVNVQHINLEDVTMFPQPTSNQLHLKVPEHHEVALVEVYDLQGKLIKSIRYQQEQFLLSINVKTLPNGVYVLRLIMDGKEVRKKFQVFHP